jgi:hypothetical protein
MHGPQQMARPVSYRRVGGVGTAAAILIGIAVVFDFASTWTTWNTYWVVTDYYAGEAGVTDSDMYEVDETTAVVGLGYLAAIVAAGIVFIVWLWLARLNAEMFCSARHRRARGWVIGAWICPIVNLWFPFMIVDDVYRASRPGNPSDLLDLRSVPGSRVLGLWWALYLGGLLLQRIAVSIWNNTDDVESIRTSGVVELMGSVVMAGAAVAIILTIRQINRWQHGWTVRAA